MEVPSRQFSNSQARFIAAEANTNQSRDLVDAKAQKYQDSEAIMAEVKRYIYDHSSLFHSPRDMFPYKVNWDFHNYLRPLFDSVCKSTVDFLFASTTQVEMLGGTFCQRASSIDFRRNNGL